jgi:hypothetical protein
MDCLVRRQLVLDAVEEADELLVAGALHVLRDDRAVQHVEGSEERRCACQRQTQVLDLSVSAMMAEVPRPSPLRGQYEPASPCFCGLQGAATIACKRCRSLTETVKEMPLRMHQTRTPPRKTESIIGLF